MAPVPGPHGAVHEDRLGGDQGRGGRGERGVRGRAPLRPRAGPPTAPPPRPAAPAAEAHGQHIHDRFYSLTPEMHLCLAQMYVADERFTKHYDDLAPGLPQYVHDAITAYCEG